MRDMMNKHQKNLPEFRLFLRSILTIQVTQGIGRVL